MDRYTIEGLANEARNRQEGIEAAGGDRILRQQDERPPAQMGALLVTTAAYENTSSAYRRIV